jgi:hypothetical protein
MTYKDYFSQTPEAVARRRRSSEASLRRRGIKPGHHSLYGVQVPDKLMPAVKPLVAKVRQKMGIGAAQEFAKLLVRMPTLLDPRQRETIMQALFHVHVTKWKS